jgi:hypothetical protein
VINNRHQQRLGDQQCLIATARLEEAVELITTSATAKGYDSEFREWSWCPEREVEEDHARERLPEAVISCCLQCISESLVEVASEKSGGKAAEVDGEDLSEQDREAAEEVQGERGVRGWEWECCD